MEWQPDMQVCIDTIVEAHRGINLIGYGAGLSLGTAK